MLHLTAPYSDVPYFAWLAKVQGSRKQQFWASASSSEIKVLVVVRICHEEVKRKSVNRLAKTVVLHTVHSHTVVYCLVDGGLAAVVHRNHLYSSFFSSR